MTLIPYDKRYYNKRTLTVDDLPATREWFLSSIAPPEGGSVARLDLFPLRSGSIPAYDQEPEVAIDFLRIQGLQLPQEERFQPTIDSSGDAQSYLFGRNARVYQISAFIIDTNLTSKQEEMVGHVAGHLLAKWKRVYEQIRFTKIARTKKILRLRWEHVDMFGYLMAYTPSLSAEQPDLCQLGLLFHSVSERNNVNIPRLTCPDGSVPSLLSGDSYFRLFPGETAAAVAAAAVAAATVRAVVSPRW